KARVVKRDGISLNRLDHDKLPDPLIDIFQQMEKQIEELRRQIEELQQQKAKEGKNHNGGQENGNGQSETV
ncbi:MAG: hypothetical protein K0Q81_2141, partial [Paenibacillus sp.]|nr:hypothetical protein [Paenibacillus sp.]